MDSTLNTPLTSTSTPSPMSLKEQREEEKSALILSLTELFNEIVARTKRKKNIVKKDVFYSKNIPKISIYDYISRIVHYTQIESSTLILSAISINTLMKKSKNFISLNNIHRLLISSCFINAKFNEDDFNSLQYFAKVGGISEKELKILEFEFLVKINYNLMVKEELFNEYLSFFNRKAKKFQKDSQIKKILY